MTKDRKISVYQFDYKTGVFIAKHESIREAERATNIKGSDISLSCRGLVKHAGKCIWVKVMDYE